MSHRTISTLICLAAACLVLLCPTANAAKIASLSAKDAQSWIRYTVPLPKSIAISSTVTVPRSAVAVKAAATDKVTRQAAKELRDILGPASGKGAFVITLQIGGKEASALKSLKNSDQAYSIAPVGNASGLRLVALKPAGIYYAAKTLQQLLKPRISGNDVRIPLLKVTDWPDLADRGLWGTDSYARLKWMADRKMNVVEQISSLEVDKSGRGHAGLKSGRETMINEAPLYAMKPIPSILHLDQISGKGVLDAYPELKGIGGEEGALCYSHPQGIITILSDWMVDLKKLHDVDEVDCWLSENLHGKGGCKCPECSKIDRSVLEARIVVQAWRKAQERAGNFDLRILTSEETGQSNAQIMKELPTGVKLWYYHSLFTYTSAHMPMIPPEVEQYARGGRWAGVVPSLCAWVNYLEPFSSAQFMSYRMNEFVDKKLSGLLGYASPSIAVTRFNTEAAAEWGWNAKGRSPREFAAAWALREGIKDPEKFADWSDTMGPVEWDIYASEWPASEKRRFPGQVAGLLQKGQLPDLGEVKYVTYRGPWGDIKNVARLDADVANAAKGVQLAKELGVPEFVQESLAADGYIKSLKALYELKQIVGANGIKAGKKEEATKYFAMYLQGLKQATTALPAWERIVWPDPSYGLLCESSLKLVNRSMDQMRQVASELGIVLP